MTSTDIQDQGLNLRRAASMLLFADAVVHVIAFIAAGFSGLGLIVAAAIYAVCGFGLSRGWPVFGPVAFFVLIFGISVALAGAMSGTGIFAILMAVILVLDILAFVTLFLLFWRR